MGTDDGLKIEIDEANIGQELAQHAAKLVFVSEEAVKAQLAHDTFKVKVNELAALIDRDSRIKFEGEKKKFTEKMIQNEVDMNADYKKAVGHLLQLKANAEILKSRKEAWKDRGSMLVQLSSNKRAEMEALSYDSIHEKVA